MALRSMEEPQSDIDRSDDRSLQTAESLRVLREQADQTLGAHKQRVGEIETRLNEQLELIAEELANERLADKQTLADSAECTESIEQLQKTLAEKEGEVEEVLDQLATQALDFENLLAERDEELEQVLELGEEECQQKESLEQELATAQQTLENVQNQESAEISQVREDLAEIEQQRYLLDEQLSTLRQEHATQLEALQTAQQAEQTTLQAELDEARLVSATAEEESKNTCRKFELALADTQKLKRENAELHEELLSRPEANDQESPELVSLRVERDALAERIEELENTPMPTASAEGQQELEDLQSRFEMAVDDVRQLKQENTKLREQRNAAPVANSNDEPLDWQAQKARLLAELDAEDQTDIDEPRREERATIEGTVSITDRVVAEKDAMLSEWEAEVADLQSQLEARSEGQDLEELREQISAEILGDEEAVQTECAKLQQQQEQLEGKLRQAELDISVQRATLAREQAELEEKLQALSSECPEEKKSSSEGKPRRRWLSALGLKEEE